MILKSIAQNGLFKIFRATLGPFRGTCQYIEQKEVPDHNILWSGTYGRGDAI